ncbi:MAG TPA: hypothetical protein VKP04_06515 [Ktedonobacteraceae bacterium]|nr:hypothetical protein [Ktedonobacteraceae bacterium]
MDPSQAAQFKPYAPWFIIAGVFALFILLRVTRRELRSRVDEIGYRFMGNKGLLIWYWINAPGVIVHELSHAIVVLLFAPWGFRLTSVTLFRIRKVERRDRSYGNVQRQSLQLGEVQYTRAEGRFMSYVGDGLSGVAPLFGGIVMFSFLYWVSTGYNIWDIHLQFFRPGWPWWTLLFAPYLILTVTSELWPSQPDWRGASRFVIGVILLTTLLIIVLWLFKVLIFNEATLLTVSSIATHIDFALVVLLAIDILFFIVAELLARLIRR